MASPVSVAPEVSPPISSVTTPSLTIAMAPDGPKHSLPSSAVSPQAAVPPVPASTT